MHSLITWLAPWEFSPTVLAASLSACALYLAGLISGKAVAAWRSYSFFSGVILAYAVLQTHFDYYAQHMFWIHRLQHLILHHLAPFLIMLPVPQAVMASGIPQRLRRPLGLVWRRSGLGGLYSLIQQPFIASFMFVGLIYYWLIPSVHFKAMLDVSLYNLMNWSMLVDGLLFWWLILDPRTREQGARAGYGARMLILWAIMLPQLILGAYISLSSKDLYSVYAICGRIWPVSPITDQHIGGLITWIPSCMMSVVAALIVFNRWTRNSRHIQRATQASTTFT